MLTKTYNAVSLYTGVGGLDFGFEAAGFKTVAAVEIDAAACKTIRANRPKWNVIENDIHNVASEEILALANLKSGEVDILFGGPPCQPFSKSSYWVTGDTKRLDDPRAATLTAYLRVVRELKPKVFLLENVPGLIYRKKDEGLQHLLRGIGQINQDLGTQYKLNWQVLNSAHYGVPQGRERVFMVASRDGDEFVFPEPTHSSVDDADLLQGREAYRTAWDAIGDLAERPNESGTTVGGKWGDLLPTIPEGQNYLWHTNRGGGSSLFGWRTRYWSFLLKLAKNQPSWTIQAQPGSSIGPFHWTNRRLTVQEMCRIQTFPDGLVFDCSRTDSQKMIGNAVPSLMAEVLGRHIREQYFNEELSSEELSLLPPIRTPVPDPEPVMPLPSKYIELVGEHADHPGSRAGLKSKKAPRAPKQATLFAS